jgi:hypothetical protein
MSSRCADMLLCVRALRSFHNHIRNPFRVAVFQLTHLFIFPLCLGVCCELIDQFLALFPGRLRAPSGAVRPGQLVSGHCRKQLCAVSDAACLDGMSVVSSSRLIAEC